MNDIRRFIGENRPSWERLESLLAATARSGLASLDPKELRDLGMLHRKVSADLAAARTFHGESKIVAYLNDLALRSHNAVYRAPRRGALRTLIQFMKDAPAAVRARPGALAAAAILFVSGALLGAAGTVLDEDVATMILGSQFVESIRQGDYWVVNIFSAVPTSIVSAGILTNNLTVAILIFTFGVTGVLPAYMLFYNGLMLGAVLALCAEYGLLARFVPFVVPHSIIEISAILIAGAGAFVTFDGWLHPGDRTRIAGLREGARQGLTIAAAAAPVLLVAAFVEAVISPSEVLSPALRIALGLALGGALWGWILGVGGTLRAAPTASRAA